MFAQGRMHIHDYVTPGKGYGEEIENERRRIHCLTVHARTIAESVCAGETPLIDLKNMNAILKPSSSPQVYTNGGMRVFSTSSFEVIGHPPPALKPSFMRKQVFVDSEHHVWKCTAQQLLHWLDEGYYVKEMRCLGASLGSKKFRAHVRFANSWIDREFIAEHKTYLYDD